MAFPAKQITKNMEIKTHTSSSCQIEVYLRDDFTYSMQILVPNFNHFTV
jgi:hypothetical protein